jgi:iron complex outermembrane receptor protein
MVWILLAQTAWAQERSKNASEWTDTANRIARFTQLDETSILELVQSSPSTTEIVSVADVKINLTETGIEIILVTTQSDRLQISIGNEGNVSRAIVSNAQLTKPFRQENPTAGISSIAVINLDDKTIQITVTGETNVPTVELFDSEEGLIFSAASSVTSSTPTQQPTQEGQIVPVTGVQLNPTDTGIELLLQTPTGSAELLQTSDRSQGNNFIVDIPNAQLNKPFRQPNPVEGISEVSVINFDASTIRVTAAGETTLPQVELFDSNEGLIFGFTSVAPSAQTSPEQRETEKGQIITIDRVQLNPIETGFEILLLTPTGEAQNLRVVNISEGNNFIAEIQGAQLQQPLRQENPIEGVSEVTITNRDENTVLVTVIGEEKQPTVELFDSKEGLIFSATSSEQTAQGEEDIELVVTGEQDTGYRVPNASAATRTDTPIRDIPQSIQVVPRQIIEDQAITTEIIDAARNVSGVNIRSGFGGIYDDYNIRGFDNFTKLRNGFVSEFSQVAPSNIERVEVLKGPASVLYGQFEPGGVINYVTKQPLDNPYYSAEFTTGSYSFYKPSFDISGPLTEDTSLRYRLNASYQNSGSFVDFVDQEIIQVAPTLAYRIGENTNLTFAYEYVKSNGSFYDGLPIDPVLFQVPRDRFVGEPSNFLNQETNYINLTLEHQFNENWQVRSGVAIQFFSLENGAFRPDSVDPDGRTLNRFYQADTFYETNTYTLQTDIIGKFKTGSIEHQLLFGFSWQRYTFDNRSLYTSAPSLDLFDPIYGAATPIIFDDPISARFISKRSTVGLYLQDQVTLLPNLKLLIGGRYDIVSEDTTNQPIDIDGRTPLGEPSKDSFYNEAFSPRIGLVYQPIEPISLYASYSRSFVPNNERTRNGEILEPTQGTQYEIGVKTEFFEGKFAATLAAYEITKTNVSTQDPEDRNFSIAAGEVKSRGLELDLAGEPLPGWNIIASFFVNDSFVSEDNDPTLVDETFVNAPDEGASLWTTYELQEGDLKGLGFGFGIFYVGNREVELPNTFRLPSYVRADATIFYRRENWRVGLNFKNLFDKTIYEFQGVGIQVGEPFTVLGTVSVEF